MDKNHDYISRILAKSQFIGIFQDTYPTAKIHDLIDTVPAEDVQPVVHGKWIRLDMHRGMEQYKCSSCDTECYVPECMGEPIYCFCPHCGARMDLGNNK